VYVLRIGVMMETGVYCEVGIEPLRVS